VDWINLKNVFTFSIIFGLEAVRFLDRKAKRSIVKPKSYFLKALMPIPFMFCSISMWDNINKYFVLGTLAQDVTLMLMETQLTNFGLIPFWFYNLRYIMHLCDVVFLALILFSLKNLRNDIEKRPHKY